MSAPARKRVSLHPNISRLCTPYPEKLKKQKIQRKFTKPLFRGNEPAKTLARSSSPAFLLPTSPKKISIDFTLKIQRLVVRVVYVAHIKRVVLRSWPGPAVAQPGHFVESISCSQAHTHFPLHVNYSELHKQSIFFHRIWSVTVVRHRCVTNS